MESFAARQIWNFIHQREPASRQVDERVIAFLEHLEPRLMPGSPLLDAGCGRGRNALYLSRAGFHVHACDLSPVALQTTKARAGDIGLPVNLQAADLTCLPYANDQFAAAICVHVLPYHRKADLIKCLRELWRVLQPGGWLYLDLLALEDAEYGRGKELEEDTFLDRDGTPLHFSSRGEVNELLRGFEMERVTRLKLASSPARVRVSWAIWVVKCIPGQKKGPYRSETWAM